MGPDEGGVQNAPDALIDDSTSIVFLQTEIYRVRPTILEDIGSAAQWASDSWWKSGDIEKRFSEALREAYIRDGNFATSVSSPFSARPRVYSLEQDAEFRAEMAQSLKHYMLIRGIPKLLSSREETKRIGKRYEQTVHTMTTMASVKVETKSKWIFRSGLNPLTAAGWVSYSNPAWNFEMNTNIGRGSLDVFAQRSFRRNYVGEFRIKPLSQLVIGTLNRQIRPNLKGYFATCIPYGITEQIWADTTHTIGGQYSF
jgi:hypothetical protein